MAETDQEKTEEATQARREDFRKRGQVAQTRELASVFILFVAVICIWLLGRYILQTMFEVFHNSFGSLLVRSVREGDWLNAFNYAGMSIIKIVLPVFGLAWLMGFCSNIIQVGFLYNEEAVQFKPERLNPAEGLKRVFSMKSVVEGLKAIFKVSVVGAIAALIIKSELVVVPYLVTYTVEQMFIYLGDITLKLLASIGFFMAVLAGLDFLFQKYEMEQKMKMTKQEVKEELKSREGDPLIKARIRKVQREMANKRMMEDVPKADVVITNPTHIAVALKYDELTVAPKIVAKGAGLIAEKIKQIAKDNNVPVVENKPLARTMFKTLEIGQIIPKELYMAVAEILSYVFKLKGRKHV